MGLGVGLFVFEDVGEDEIEKFKQGDMFEVSFGEFVSESLVLYEIIIGECDCYMVICLCEIYDLEQCNVLVVVGVGYLVGLVWYLENDIDVLGLLCVLLEEVLKKCNIFWIILIILVIVLIGIVVGFYWGGLGVGIELFVMWVMYIGGLVGLGCLLVGSYLLSILMVIVVVLFKLFCLSIFIGVFLVLVEVCLCKLVYEDFFKFCDDVQSFKGWYCNCVIWVVFIFMLINIGSMLGLWLIGFQVWYKVGG